MTFKITSVKRFFHLIVAVIFLFGLVSSVHAAPPDFSVTVKKIEINSVTVTVKNNGPAGTTATGGYNSIIYTSATATKSGETIPVANVSGSSIIGGESKDIVIANLAANTAYRITVTAEDSFSHERLTKSVSATTQKSPEQNQPPKNLPVSFDKDATRVTETEIRMKVKNNGQKSFTIEVTMKKPDGSIVPNHPNPTLAPGAIVDVTYFSLTASTEYVFTLTGKEPTSNAPYKSETYTVKTASPLVDNPSTNQNSTQAPTTSTPTNGGKGSCQDGVDNDLDGRMDWKGGIDKNTGKALPPDPLCITKDSIEAKDDIAPGSIIPCTNKCDLISAVQLINKLIQILIKFILFPLTVVLLMYAGYKYLTAQGNPSAKANVRSMVWNLLKGILLILCAWLIVNTILNLVGYEHSTYFFAE